MGPTLWARGRMRLTCGWGSAAVQGGTLGLQLCLITVTESQALLTQAYSSDAEMHCEHTLGICFAARKSSVSFTLKTKSLCSFWRHKSKCFHQTCMDCSGGKSVHHFSCQSLDIGDKDPGRGLVLIDREPVSLCVLAVNTLKDCSPQVACKALQRSSNRAISGSPTGAVLCEDTTLPPAGSVCRCCFIPCDAPIHHSTTRTPFRFQLRHAFPSLCAPAEAIFFCHAFMWDNSPVPRAVSSLVLTFASVSLSYCLAPLLNYMLHMAASRPSPWACFHAIARGPTAEGLSALLSCHLEILNTFLNNGPHDFIFVLGPHKSRSLSWIAAMSVSIGSRANLVYTQEVFCK